MSVRRASRPAGASTHPFRLSVVIPNYNYAMFVGDAIESALAIDWDDVEVIVVDDGSTDDSAEIIRSYEPRITAIFQPNGGPRVACNTGFAASSGDVVIFLDSDDRLDRRVARRISDSWSPTVSKFQFPMLVIDKQGRPTGRAFPYFRRAPRPSQIRRWMRLTSAYPTPPGSGNAYARTFLDRLFPLGDECGDASDSACLAAAPLLGDVVTLMTPLAQYRQHGGNRSHLLADPARFTRQLERVYQRHVFAQRLDAVDGPTDAALFRGRHLLQLRAAGARVRPDDRPIPGDGKLRMLLDAMVSPFVPGPELLVHRLAVTVWTFAVLVTPRPVAYKLIRSRFRQGRAHWASRSARRL